MTLDELEKFMTLDELEKLWQDEFSPIERIAITIALSLCDCVACKMIKIHLRHYNINLEKTT